MVASHTGVGLAPLGRRSTRRWITVPFESDVCDLTITMKRAQRLMVCQGRVF